MFHRILELLDQENQLLVLLEERFGMLLVYRGGKWEVR